MEVDVYENLSPFHENMSKRKFMASFSDDTNVKLRSRTGVELALSKGSLGVINPVDTDPSESSNKVNCTWLHVLRKPRS